MRIGLVCPYSLTLPGGVQGQVLGLADALRSRGHDVRVLGPCDGPPPDAGVTPLGDSLPTAANGSVAPIAPDPSAQLRTIRALRDERFDIVNLHEPLAPGVTQTALLFKSQPLVGTFHAAGESAGYRWLNPVVRWLAGKLDLRCAVSADAREMAMTAVGGTYELLFNGVDLRAFEGGEVRELSNPTILFLGRHEPRKGLAVLLEAMRELPAEVRLWIASDGPETAELRRGVAGDMRIEWLGRISEAEKIERLRSATVFCAPSLRGESFGVVLLEAMAAHTAVVATMLPGYANVARADLDALLVTPGDARALADALRRVLFDRELNARLVESGATRATGFSMAELAAQYEGLYERVLRHR
ncbi:MAG: glycosyltransferase family 1 protein [Actinobacteria bacterium]|nr:glycosyltransferase family 1 protein [Actinomycetota bacterium]